MHGEIRSEWRVESASGIIQPLYFIWVTTHAGTTLEIIVGIIVCVRGLVVSVSERKRRSRDNTLLLVEHGIIDMIGVDADWLIKLTHLVLRRPYLYAASGEISPRI